MPRKASSKDPAYTAHSAVVNPPSGTDLLQRLTYEHRELRKMWNDMQRAHIRERGEGQAVDHARLGDTRQADLGPQIMQALAEHEALELDLLYPAAAEVMSEEWVNHAMAEHAEVRDLLHALEIDDLADEDAFEIFSGALTRIVAHMDEEDRVLFPILRMSMRPADLIIDSHAPSGAKAPKVIDLTAAERQIEARANAGADSHGVAEENGEREANGHAGDEGDGHGDGNGRKPRRGLLRRR